MPSASEMQRSLSEQYEEACDRFNNLKLSKESRENALREARRLAAELGIAGPEPVNGRPPIREESEHQPRDPYQNMRDEFEQDATSLQVGDAVRYRPDGLIQRVRDCVGVVTDLDYDGRGKMLAVSFIRDGVIDNVGCFQSTLIKLAPVK